MSICFHHDEAKPVTFYTWVMSPFAMKVHSFLLYKRLNFQTVFVNPLRRRAQIPLGEQLPVVKIGTEVRADSTPIGLWLDECFPEQPMLLPADEAERDHLLAINEWVGDRLIPIVFRAPQEPGFNLSRIRNGWRLSRVMSQTAHGGLPKLVEWAWPAILSLQPFLKDELAKADPESPLDEVKRRLHREFVDHLAGGPFFGGRSSPSLPDVAAYPQFLVPYMVGIDKTDYFLDFPEVVQWLKDMEPYVVGNPPIVPDVVVRRELPWHQVAINPDPA